MLAARPDIVELRRAPGAVPVVLVLCMLGATLGISGCAHMREPGSRIVRSIRFDGNGGFLGGTGDYQLRRAMAQQKSSTASMFLPFIEPEYLDSSTLEKDAWRIEVWYAHHGFSTRVSWAGAS